MNPEFVESIHEPRSLQLQSIQDEAWEVVTERLDAYGMTDVPERVVRKLTYAYYHDWETDDPDYMFLLADPGIPGEHVIFETNAYVELGDDWNLHDAIQIDRRFGARWLTKREYTDFSAEFIDLCRDAGLIEGDRPWWQYLLSHAFFDDFYMTDVIKYRGTSVSSADVDASFTECLIHELEYVEPELVFAFGKRAWTALRDRLNATPVAEPPANQSVVDVHGVLHETDRLVETYVLPLGHPSPNFRGAQLSQKAYMDGVRDGLEQHCGSSQ